MYWYYLLKEIIEKTANSRIGRWGSEGRMMNLILVTLSMMLTRGELFTEVVVMEV